MGDLTIPHPDSSGVRYDIQREIIFLDRIPGLGVVNTLEAGLRGPGLESPAEGQEPHGSDHRL